MKTVERLAHEISQCTTDILELIKLICTLTVLALAAGVAADNGYVLLAPFAIILPANTLVLHRLHLIWRAAAYIEVFEPDEEISVWERRLHEVRKKEKGYHELRFLRSTANNAFIMACVLPGWLCSLTCWAMLFKENFYFGLAVNIAWGLVSAFYIIELRKVRGTGTVVDKYIKIWDDMKYEENKKQ